MPLVLRAMIKHKNNRLVLRKLGGYFFVINNIKANRLSVAPFDIILAFYRPYVKQILPLLHLIQQPYGLIKTSLTFREYRQAGISVHHLWLDMYVQPVAYTGSVVRIPVRPDISGTNLLSIVHICNRCVVEIHMDRTIGIIGYIILCCPQLCLFSPKIPPASTGLGLIFYIRIFKCRHAIILCLPRQAHIKKGSDLFKRPLPFHLYYCFNVNSSAC